MFVSFLHAKFALQMKVFYYVKIFTKLFNYYQETRSKVEKIRKFYYHFYDNTNLLLVAKKSKTITKIIFNLFR